MSDWINRILAMPATPDGDWRPERVVVMRRPGGDEYWRMIWDGCGGQSHPPQHWGGGQEPSPFGVIRADPGSGSDRPGFFLSSALRCGAVVIHDRDTGWHAVHDPNHAGAYQLLYEELYAGLYRTIVVREDRVVILSAEAVPQLDALLAFAEERWKTAS